MRHKPLPPAPDDLAAIRAAREAVPLVPGSEDDCCARLLDRLDLTGRDLAATWLRLLVALGLAEEGPGGYTRVRGAALEREALADAFLAGVYGAREVCETLSSADDPLDADAVFAATVEHVPAWERRKHGAEWEAVWRARTADLLDWLVLLGLAERVDGGYRSAPTD